MPAGVFELWVDVYELLVDWPRRLEREGPMFRRLFAETSVRRVLDVACGPGYHAAMFHRWGLEVEGADLSQPMIQRAIALHGQPTGLRWVVRSFQTPAPAPGYFDAALCIGNSLALAGDKQAAAEAIRQMVRAVRPGGLIVIQVLNLWALPEGATCWQKCLAVCLGGQPKLILKGIHRVADRAIVNLLLVDLPASAATSPPAGQGAGQAEPSQSTPPSAISPDSAPTIGSGFPEVEKSSALEATSPDSAPQIGAQLGRAVSLPWQAQSEVLLGFSAEELQEMVRQAGADPMLLYGGYPDQPYQLQTSQDLILAAWRSENFSKVLCASVR